MNKWISVAVFFLTVFVSTSAIAEELAIPITVGGDKPPVHWPPSDIDEARYILRLEGQPLVGRVSGKGAASRAARAQAREEIDRQQSRVAQLVRQNGGTVLRQFGLLENAIVLLAKPKDLPAIQRIKGVHSLVPDQQVRALLTTSVDAINAPALWATLDNAGVPVKGSGVTVGIIDTGVDYTHPDLGGCLGAGCKVAGGYDFVNGDADPMDDHFHGTHVAGIVAANGSVLGVAPEATLFAYKVLSAGGAGYQSDIIAAVEASTDPNGDDDTSDHLHVINLSLGGPGDPDGPLAAAVNNAVDEGVVAVVAAGNSGPGLSTIDTPGNAERALTVAAYDHHSEMIANFSSRGPIHAPFVKPDISAPGVSINSTMPGGAYDSLSGTSMAAPHVAGAVALLLQAYPNLSPSDVAARLLTSAHAIPGESFAAQGAGVLDVMDAWQQSLVADVGKLHLGRVDNSATSWSGSASFSVRNTGSVTEHVELGITPDPEHQVTYGYSPSVFDLAPGDTQTVYVDVLVNVPNLGFPEDGHVDFATHVQGTSNSLRLPSAFMRAVELGVDFAVNGGGEWVTIGVIHDTDPVVWVKTVHTSAAPSARFYAEPGVYHAVAAFANGAVVTGKLDASEDANEVVVALDSASAVLALQPAVAPSQGGASDWSQVDSTWTYWGYRNSSNTVGVEFLTQGNHLSPSSNGWRFSSFQNGPQFFFRSSFVNQNIHTSPAIDLYVHTKHFDEIAATTDNAVSPVYQVVEFNYANEAALLGGVEVYVFPLEMDTMAVRRGINLPLNRTEPFTLRLYSALASGTAFLPQQHATLTFRSNQGIEQTVIPTRASLNQGTRFLTLNTEANQSVSNALMLLDEFPYTEFDITGAQRYWTGKPIADSNFLLLSNSYYGAGLEDRFDVQVIGDAALIGQDFFANAVTYRLSVDGALVADSPLPIENGPGTLYLGSIPVGSSGVLELEYPIDLGAVAGTGKVFASWPDGAKLRGPYLKKFRIHRPRSAYEDPGPLVSDVMAGSTVYIDFAPADDDGSIVEAALEYSLDGSAWLPLSTYLHGDMLRAEMPYVAAQPYDRTFGVRIALEDDDGNTMANTIDPAFVITGNAPPVADAGGSYNVTAGGSVLLDGSASYDPDDGPGPLNYWWLLPGGESGIKIDAPYSTLPTTTLNVASDYSGSSPIQLWLIVDDGADSSVQQVELIIN